MSILQRKASFKSFTPSSNQILLPQRLQNLIITS